MFSKKSNPFKKFVENTNKLAQTLQPPQQNSSENSVIKKDIFDGQSKLFNTNKKSENEDLIMKSSNTPKYITSYTPPNESVREKYLNDISSNLIKMHGSKPSLVLGFNPSILTHQKDTDGVSMQIKGLINDLNYQLNVTGFQDPKGIVLPFCDITDLDIGVLVQTLKHFAFDLTTIDLSYNRLGNGAVENLFYTMGTHQTPAKYVKNINLSNNFIGDYGAEYIAQSVKSGRYPNLKLLNIGSNQITPEGFQNMNNILGQVPQEILIITENIENLSDNGQAVFKSSKGDFYDMVVKSDGKDTVIEFADGITGISAGDTCPAPVKDQIIGCLTGAVGTGVTGAVGCLTTNMAYPICVANAALLGCGVGIYTTSLNPCIKNSYELIENAIGDNDKSSGFTVDGGHEIQGTYIDNDHGLHGSNFDLSQHDF